MQLLIRRLRFLGIKVIAKLQLDYVELLVLMEKYGEVTDNRLFSADARFGRLKDNVFRNEGICIITGNLLDSCYSLRCNKRTKNLLNLRTEPNSRCVCLTD